MYLLGIIGAIAETIVELVVLLGIILIPFCIIGLICEAIKFALTDTYKMGSRKQKLHRKIYNYLCRIGYDRDVAYRFATKITGWR